MRVRYTARRKLGLLTAVERLQHEKGLTLRREAERLFVAHSLIAKWKKQQALVMIPLLPCLGAPRTRRQPMLVRLAS
jgi:hypothetical protein